VSANRDYLGRYRLIRLIRAGASCQVWEAIDDIDHRKLALKALQPELRADKQEIAFLRHEFEVGKGFSHPNVIEVYDFSTDRSIPYLALELSTGRNFKQALREGYETIAHKLVHIIQRAAEGLAYFHEQGWVHRDVKPDNFLVDEQWDVKLIDFALAQKQAGMLSKLFSMKGKIQGTRSYMAPEQIRGKAPQQTADIYSFGCMVFELLSGKLPYTASTPEELLHKHLQAGVPSVNVNNSNVTVEFNDLVFRMMSKNAEARPQSMQEFLDEMKALRVFRVTPKPPAEDAVEEQE